MTRGWFGTVYTPHAYPDIVYLVLVPTRALVAAPALPQFTATFTYIPTPSTRLLLPGCSLWLPQPPHHHYTPFPRSCPFAYSALLLIWRDCTGTPPACPHHRLAPRGYLPPAMPFLHPTPPTPTPPTVAPYIPLQHTYCLYCGQFWDRVERQFIRHSMVLTLVAPLPLYCIVFPHPHTTTPCLPPQPA